MAAVKIRLKPRRSPCFPAPQTTAFPPGCAEFRTPRMETVQARPGRFV